MNIQELIVKWNGGKFRGAQTRFAEAVGTTPQTVSRWISGDSEPEPDVRPKAAKLLGIPIAQLMASLPSLPESVLHVETEPRSTEFVFAGKSIGTIPVLGVVAADRFAFSFDSYPEQYLPIPAERGRQLFALRISGDCMEPTFRDKDLVILNPNELPTDGKVVLAQLDGEHTLKRYFKRADGVELRPDNPKYKSLKMATKHLTIRGVVVGTYRTDI